MFWYNSPQAAKAMSDMYVKRDDGVDRRSGLRLIGRADGH